MVQLPSGYKGITGPVEILIRDLEAGLKVVATISASIWPETEPLFSADGKYMYLQTRDSRAPLGRWNLDSGECDTIPGRNTPDSLPHNEGVNWWKLSQFAGTRPQIDPSRKRLIVEVDRMSGRGVGIFDWDRSQWIAQLAYPSTSLMIGMELSPDGRTLAVFGSRKNEKVGGWPVPELLLYDLSVID